MKIMNKIIALTDYKNNFGSKYKAQPYRSGFDKELIKTNFNKRGYEVEFIRMKEVDFNDDWKNKIVIYTSSEEIGLNYKSFIEDVVFGLERAGAFIIPRYDLLRAHSNKVYMEILRERLLGEKVSGNKSLLYGTLEELIIDIKREKIKYPCVIKASAGAMSRGVFLANNNNELEKSARKLSRSPHYISELKDILRSKKHNGYQMVSKYQNKFIIQKFIPELKNDWKVLVYGNRYYVLNRGIKQNDFRASGSHYNYRAGSKSGITELMLDSIKVIFEKLDVPHLSLDFAFDGKSNIIHEFQAIYFGTSTIDFSDDLFVFENGRWEIQKKKLNLEEEYVWGVVKYLEKHPELLSL